MIQVFPDSLHIQRVAAVDEVLEMFLNNQRAREPATAESVAFQAFIGGDFYHQRAGLRCKRPSPIDMVCWGSRAREDSPIGSKSHRAHCTWVQVNVPCADADDGVSGFGTRFPCGREDGFGGFHKFMYEVEILGFILHKSCANVKPCVGK